jgi:hypothetical protein
MVNEHVRKPLRIAEGFEHAGEIARCKAHPAAQAVGEADEQAPTRSSLYLDDISVHRRSSPPVIISQPTPRARS